MRFKIFGKKFGHVPSIFHSKDQSVARVKPSNQEDLLDSADQSQHPNLRPLPNSRRPSTESPISAGTGMASQSGTSSRLFGRLALRRNRQIVNLGMQASPVNREVATDSSPGGAMTSEIRFNEVINCLESVETLSDATLEKLESSSLTDQIGMPTLAGMLKKYMHSGCTAPFALGEALTEMTRSGRFSASPELARVGILSPSALETESKKDPGLAAVIRYFMGRDGQIIPANSPLPQLVKESHSIEFLNLCAYSSRRPLISMPGMDAVVDAIRAKNPSPLAAAFIFQAQHAFDTDESQAYALFRLGLKPDRLWYFAKTGARSMPMARLRSMGTHIGDHSIYDTRDFEVPALDMLVEFVDDAFKLDGMSPTQQVKRLEFLSDPANVKMKPQVLLVDEGLKIGKALATLQLSPDALEARKFCLVADLCSMVAHTEGDIIKGNALLATRTKPGVAPFLPRSINMAQCPAKRLEGPQIGLDVWLTLSMFLEEMNAPEATTLRPKETLQIGYGIVAAKAMPPLQAGHDVWIWDLSPRSLLQAYQHHEGTAAYKEGKIHIPVDLETLKAVVERGGLRNDPAFVAALDTNKAEWFSHGHNVVGSTGAPGGCLRGGDFELLPDGALLISSGSGDYEFGNTEARLENDSIKKIEQTKTGRVSFALAGEGTEPIEVKVASKDRSYDDHQVFETNSDKSNAKRFMLMRGGRAANRMYGSPPPFIDVSKALMVASIYESSLPHDEQRPESGLWLAPLDSGIQDLIVKTVNENLEKNGLGSLEDPSLGQFDQYWHRPAVSIPPNFHTAPFSSDRKPTLARFVHSGLATCEAYEVSVGSFSLLANPHEAGSLLTNARLGTLRKITSGRTAVPPTLTESEVPSKPQRNIAHTLYALFASDDPASMPSVHEKVNSTRQKLKISNEDWAILLQAQDVRGLRPERYGVLPGTPLAIDSATTQDALISMQRCIATLTVNPPTQSQLRGTLTRRADIRKQLESL